MGGSFYKGSLEIGADYIATGHYARIAQLENGRYAIQNSVTARKDQTYALYNLTQWQLEHTLMPVGAYHKEEIRKIAAREGLFVANKPDSQEICFIPDNNYKRFLEEETGKKSVPGNFVDASGKVLGQHKGITHYTIGQRKGLGIAFGHPVFVSEIRPESNEVVLGNSEEVFFDRLIATDINYMAADKFTVGQRMLAKIRYADLGQMCTVEDVRDDQITIAFDQKARAVTPGQAVVFYEDGYVLGGATIQKGIK